MGEWSDLEGWDGVTVRPISTWPGGATAGARRSPFDAPWSTTVGDLSRELRLIGARRVVLELAISESEIRLDGQPYARARARHPGVVLSFESDHGPLRYATAEFETWQANLRAIALGLEALRKVDRYGIAKRGEQYRGYRQIESGGPSAERGRALIHKHGDVRRALMATHPDHGGDAAAFADVQAAREASA